MSLKLYYDELSAPCRAVHLTLKALNLEGLVKFEHVSHEDYLMTELLELSPFCSLPKLELPLDKKSLVLWNSHSINSYLVDKYGDETLYPKNLEQRVKVEEMQHFDSNILGPRLGAIVRSVLSDGAKTVTKDKADPLIQGYGLLEEIFQRSQSRYVAGNSLTIADFSIVTTISTAHILVPLATNRFPLIVNWLGSLQQLPYYGEANQSGLNTFALQMKTKIRY